MFNMHSQYVIQRKALQRLNIIKIMSSVFFFFKGTSRYAFLKTQNGVMV